MRRPRSVVGWLFWAARRRRDLRALRRDPGAYAKRRLRRKAYARTNGTLQRVLRSLGL